jgi:PAS domain S-box-containing protein
METAASHPLQTIDLSLVDALVVPASVHDIDGRFMHMNAGAERASGHTNHELVGRRYTELLPAGERHHVEAQFRRAVERGEPTDFETMFVDAGGHLRGTRAQQLPLRDGDEIVGVLILAFDVRTLPPVAHAGEPQPRLTRRQREILDLVAAGLSTPEVAERLTLSTETVRNHLRNIFRELKAHTRLEALAAAQRVGLLAAPPLGPQPADPAAGLGGGARHQPK